MEQKSNTIIYILSMLGGLLTAALLIVLLALMDIFSHDISGISTSIVMIAAAIALSRTKKPFLDAINITLYIAGYMIPFFMNFDLYSVFLMVVGIVAFLYSRSFLLSCLATVAFNSGLYLLLSDIFFREDALLFTSIMIIIAFLAINLFREKIQSVVAEKCFNYQSLHTALFISIFIVLPATSIYHTYDWQLSLLIWICTLITVHQIMQTMDIKKPVTQCWIYIISLIALAPTLYAPYLCGSLFLLFLCFHYRYMKEFVASLLLLIYAVSKYYEDLSFTLLVKSILLFTTGVVFLIAWSLLTQKTKSHE